MVTFRPRSAGTLAIGRSRTSRIASVVRMTSSISGHDTTSRSSRWRWRQATAWVSGAASTDGTTTGASSAGGEASVAVDELTRPVRPRAPDLDAIDENGVLVVDLLEVDLDDLLARGRHVLADMIGPDRQLAVAPVDEYGQADGLRPTEVDERVHCGADRPPGVEDVVDEDDRRAVEIERQIRALDDWLLGDEREVVTVEGDVERPDRHIDPLVLRDRGGNSAGERDAPTLDPDERETRGSGLLLDDLVGDPDRRPADLLRGHDVAAAHPLLPGLTGPPRRPHGAEPKGRRQDTPAGTPAGPSPPDASGPDTQPLRAGTARVGEHGRRHIDQEAHGPCSHSGTRHPRNSSARRSCSTSASRPNGPGSTAFSSATISSRGVTRTATPQTASPGSVPSRRGRSGSRSGRAS